MSHHTHASVYISGSLSDILLQEFLGVLSASFSDDVNKVVRQHKRDPLSLHSKLALEVPQKVAEINVHQLKDMQTKKTNEDIDTKSSDR